jgi:raffinose/stachyose/melibiose transport system permease protein
MIGRATRDASLPEQLLFLGPASIFFAIAVLLPFAFSIFYAFTNWNGISQEAALVGLKNFRAAFAPRSDFLNAFWFTLRMALVNIVLVTALGTTLAVALTTSMKLEGAFRVAFYLPQTMGGLILGFIWQFIFVSGFPSIGKLLCLGYFTQQWLGTESTAFTALAIVSVWQGVGYVMLIMIAALSGMPKEVLESARIDGSGALRTFVKIKLPLCMPYISVCLFWTTANALKMFELNFSLTKGGPYGSTVSMAMNIYNDAFSKNKYGLATAESLIFFVIILAITSLQMGFTKRKEKEYL